MKKYKVTLDNATPDVIKKRYYRRIIEQYIDFDIEDFEKFANDYCISEDYNNDFKSGVNWLARILIYEMRLKE